MDSFPAEFRYRECRGRELAPWLEELGRLRIEVFREFPYLYEGSPEYERDYLASYLAAPGSFVVLLESEGRIVGATTALPLADAEAEFQRPFLEAGMPVEEVFYLGESIILPPWRGAGSGSVFMERREREAKRQGFRLAAFCAVDRPADDPRRPAGYRPLNAFWTRRGYRRRDDLAARLAWKEVGGGETENTLTFWLRELD